MAIARMSSARRGWARVRSHPSLPGAREVRLARSGVHTHGMLTESHGLYARACSSQVFCVFLPEYPKVKKVRYPPIGHRSNWPVLDLLLTGTRSFSLFAWA